MTEPFRDPALPTRDRVTDLLARMTLREKVGQLNQRLLGWETWTRSAGNVRTTPLLDEEIERWGGVGAIYGLFRADAWSGRDWSDGADPALSAEVAARVQERVVAGSRHGIPALFVEEAPHGHQALGGRLLPTDIGVAATWRPELLEEASAATALEVRARGAHLALVSGLDIARDPRWGRTEETFGEDPLLASEFTRAMVRGLQSVTGIGAVLKHFAGQGAAIGGRNSSGAPLGPHELAEIHLPAARAGVDEGAVGVMAAYNDIDGIPCIANRALLTGILRDEWDFGGLVMADMFAIDRLTRVTASPAHSAALALRAGVDLSMSDLAFTHIEEALERGLLGQDVVDTACGRVLAVKIRLGLLDEPAPLPAFPPPSPATELVAAGPVLLANDGTLPLDLAAARRIAVIGPTGDDLDAQLGDYVPPLPAGTGLTILGGLRERLGAGVRYERGSDLRAPIEDGLDRAVALAADSDVVVLALGSSSGRSYDDDFQANGAAALGGRVPAATSGEGFDIGDIALPAAQRELAAAVAATGVPCVAVVVSGRPLGIDALVEGCAAVLYAWYPGPDGGSAIAGLLVGDREPAGRLPVSLPHSSGTLPVAYNERLETTLRYVDGEAAAAFTFGFGLGWSDWALQGPWTVEAIAPGFAGSIIAGSVTNTGRRQSHQVVELYGRARIPGVLPRKAVLLGYSHVDAAPGETLAVQVSIRADALPGLGIGTDTGAEVEGQLDLWLSVTGAGDPVDPIVVDFAEAARPLGLPRR